MTMGYLNLPARDLEQEIVTHLENVSLWAFLVATSRYLNMGMTAVGTGVRAVFESAAAEKYPAGLGFSGEGTCYPSQEEGFQRPPNLDATLMKQLPGRFSTQAAPVPGFSADNWVLKTQITAFKGTPARIYLEAASPVSSSQSP